jgi:hypothetical protein
MGIVGSLKIYPGLLLRFIAQASGPGECKEHLLLAVLGKKTGNFREPDAVGESKSKSERPGIRTYVLSVLPRFGVATFGLFSLWFFLWPATSVCTQVGGEGQYQ